MAIKGHGLLLVLLVLSSQTLGTNALWREIAGGVVGVSVAAGAPFALGAVGFGAGGIAAGSVAAKAMSVVYTSGVGLGVLGAAQSIGAAGVSATTVAVSGAVGAVVAKVFKK